MATKTLLSLATVSLLAFAAKADTYTVETTNSWFSVDAASKNLSSTGTWTVSPTQQGGRIVVDTEAGSPVKYTPSEARPTASTRYRVKGNMTVTLNAGVPADDVFGNDLPKAALVAASVNEDDNEVKKWYGWDGDSWVDLSSVDLSPRITAEPEDGDSCNVAIEFFVEDSQLKIKYIVDTQSATVTASGSTLPTLTQVGLAGYGSFGDFGALGFDSFTVTVTLSQDQMTAMGIDGDITTALNEVGENGLTKWESIVLGLPNSSTKPYTAPVQTNNGNLGFTIGNVNTSNYGATGASATFDVYEYDIGNQTLGTKVTKTSVAAGSTAEVTAPTANAGVKYYKIKITFANP